MEDVIVNKVAQSPLITIDLKDFYPQPAEYALFDMADFLYERLVLKEKDFRQKLKEIEYLNYKDKFLGVFCSEDAVVPRWAYLLVVTHFYPYVKNIFFTDKKHLIECIMNEKISALDVAPYKDKLIVIKGCSDIEIPVSAYVLLTQRLMPVAKSIMYGEPCSTVPLFKRK